MKDLLLSYYEKRRAYCTRDYLDDLVNYHAIPVVHAGKPSSLITLSRSRRSDIFEIWQQEKEMILPEGVKFEELYIKDDLANILLYDSEALDKLLTKPANQLFLRILGYTCDFNCLNLFFRSLKERFAQSFPHEIGILLGIPLYDVLCFMFYPEKKPLCRGYWKVYINEVEARQTFLRYNNCKIKYIQYVLDSQDN